MSAIGMLRKLSVWATRRRFRRFQRSPQHARSPEIRAAWFVCLYSVTSPSVDWTPVVTTATAPRIAEGGAAIMLGLQSPD
jgi:hypothetical protein